MCAEADWVWVFVEPCLAVDVAGEGTLDSGDG